MSSTDKKQKKSLRRKGDELLHGRVLGLKDIITFQGKSIKQLQRDFHESVDEYLNYCQEKEKTVKKTFSGVFTYSKSPI